MLDMGEPVRILDQWDSAVDDLAHRRDFVDGQPGVAGGDDLADEATLGFKVLGCPGGGEFEGT